MLSEAIASGATGGSKAAVPPVIPATYHARQEETSEFLVANFVSAQRI